MRIRRVGSGKFIERSGDPVLLDVDQDDPVNARCAVVPTHRNPRLTPSATGSTLSRPFHADLQATNQNASHDP
jgi:hypothetical protein